MGNPLRIEHSGQIAWLDRDVLDGEWALNHRDHHTAVLTGVEVTMRSVLWYEHGFPSRERSVIVANDNDSFALPAEHDLIGNGMTMKAVLLAWFKAVDVAMEMIGLPNTLPHKSAWGEPLDIS